MPNNAIVIPTAPEIIKAITPIIACSFTLICLNNIARGVMEKLAKKKPKKA